jgi:transcriptional regulator with XRE-family HTH domain
MQKHFIRNDSLNLSFASFIRRKRLELGIPQQELSKFLGISQGALSGLERGEYKIALTDFVRFAKRYAPEITIDLPEEVRNKDILCKLTQYFNPIGILFALFKTYDKTPPFHPHPFFSIP